jgi:glucosamine-6-phosphate deaminase
MIKSYLFSGIEQEFFLKSKRAICSTNIPYIVVPNFPALGFFTALRFLEWVNDNPNGVISLPTGKTPEHFIKWTKFILDNWNKNEVKNLLRDNGLLFRNKPELNNLHFVQIDEFYPINPEQHNSFYNYVNEYYIDGFGLDKNKALLINSEEIELAQGKHFSEIFPDNTIDLSLRNRTPINNIEKLQQDSIFKIDNWCSNYESEIRKLGGIGFFLGGIGPDGHIAFNIKGSDLNSTTRLTQTNFETQAASAGDLGGIEVSRNRLVITIGLGTITYNTDGVSIIFAAGEAKANIIKNALESDMNNRFPATVLQRQNNARFFITEGAASQLSDSKELYYSQEWNFERTERVIYDYCNNQNIYSSKISTENIDKNSYVNLIPNLDNSIIEDVVRNTKEKISKGLKKQKDQRYLHTGPHHDDIMLGIFPDVITQLREPSNEFYFAILTSGFTAVTNQMMKQLLNSSLELIEKGRIQMLDYPNFFTDGYKFKWDKDVSHYLNKVSERDEEGKLRGVCHRIIRSIVSIYGIRNTKELKNRILTDISILENSYDGEKNPADIQKLKGMLREFEEELVWAHFGVPVKNIEHLRLGFYSGDIFTEEPSRGRDVEPILDLLRRVNPTRISVAFDPEGSGPDTHYKVLQAIAEALRQWSKEKDLSEVKVIGYRNVWYKFHPAEANVFLPVSLNSLAILENSFKDCYISQVNASFPSPYYDGPFSNLSQKIWSQQFKDVQLITGKSFFYENESHKIRATHGMIYYKEMELEEFLTHARSLEKSMEGAFNL